MTTLLPLKLTAPVKVLDAFVKSMLPVPAAIPVVPPTDSAPVCVTLPLPLWAVRLPPTVEVPRFKAPVEFSVKSPAAAPVPKVSGPASVMATLLPLKLTGPVSTLSAWVKVISAGVPPLLAVKVLAPPTFNALAPDCVIAPPFVVTTNAPGVLKLPKAVPPLGLLKLTLLPEIFTNDRLPAACVISTLPPMARVPPVWAKELVPVKLPAPATDPPLWR